MSSPAVSSGSTPSKPKSTSLPAGGKRTSPLARIVIDWPCFSPVVRRAGLGVFTRTLLQLVRDHGEIGVTRIIVLLDRGDQHTDAKLISDMGTYSLSVTEVVVEYHSPPQDEPRWVVQISDVRTDQCNIPYLRDADSAALMKQTEIDEMLAGGLILLASSRIYMFGRHISHWQSIGHRLLFVHGNGKRVHSLPPGITIGSWRPQLSQLIQECTNSLEQLKKGKTVTSPEWLDKSTIEFNIHLLDSIGQFNNLSSSSHLLLGIYSIWSLPIWYDLFEQCVPTCSLPAAAMCPQWNSGLQCPSLPCSHPHSCQACGQNHKLQECRVNSYHSKENNLDESKMKDYMEWHYTVWKSLLRKQSSQFEDDRWKWPYTKQMAKYHQIVTPSGTVEATPGSTNLPSCHAIVFVDWHSVHVPLKYIPDFLSTIENFVAVDRPGVSSIRIRALMDTSKQSEIAKEFKRLNTQRVPVDVVHVDTAKGEMMDQKITSLMRSEPQGRIIQSNLGGSSSSSTTVSQNVTISKQADLICLVSGEVNFSSELTRLVMRGHRVLLIHNSQARFGFRVNPLWEQACDFLTLPQLRKYREKLLEKRAMKKAAAEDASSHSSTLQVGTIQLANGPLQNQIGGIGSIAWDVTSHSILFIESSTQQLMQLRHPSSDQLVGSELIQLAGLRIPYPSRYYVGTDQTRSSKEVQFQDLQEVLVHPVTGEIILCDCTQNSILLLNRLAGTIKPLQPAGSRVSSPPRGRQSKISRPRYLHLDAKNNRLWLTDLVAGQTRLGFFRLWDSFAFDSMCISRPFVDVHLDEMSRDSLAMPKPTCKCIAPNGSDLIYWDDEFQGFYQLNVIGSDDKMSFTTTLLAPFPAASGPRGVKSLTLDVDGSYLFIDEQENVLKRLVYNTVPKGWIIRTVACRRLVQGQTAGASVPSRLPGYLALDPSSHKIYVSDVDNRALRVLSANQPTPNWKMTRCQPFQTGLCNFQLDHEMCPFLHTCMACGGPHTNRDLVICRVQRDLSEEKESHEEKKYPEPLDGKIEIESMKQENAPGIDGSSYVAERHPSSVMTLENRVTEVESMERQVEEMEAKFRQMMAGATGEWEAFLRKGIIQDTEHPDMLRCIYCDILLGSISVVTDEYKSDHIHTELHQRLARLYSLVHPNEPPSVEPSPIEQVEKKCDEPPEMKEKDETEEEVKEEVEPKMELTVVRSPTEPTSSPPSGEDESPPTPVIVVPPDACLIVIDVSSSLNESDLLNFFAEFGSIIDIEVDMPAPCCDMTTDSALPIEPGWKIQDADGMGRTQPTQSCDDVFATDRLQVVKLVATF